MTKAQAHAEAGRRWGTSGTTDTDRVPVTLQRRKSAGADRCSVGYYQRGWAGKRGADIMGTGPTWEAAFAAAEGKDPICGPCSAENPPGETRHVAPYCTPVWTT